MGGTMRVLASRAPFHRHRTDDAPVGVGTGTR
jgi:hypothetical protein